MDAKQLTSMIVQTINLTPNIEKIILFGSRAKKDADERSDFDIAIICPAISNREWLELCEHIDDLPTLLTIDLVRFDTASDELKNRILQEGKVLYEKS